MTVRIDQHLTNKMREAHLAFTGNVPPPKGFHLIVGEGDITYVFFDRQDNRIADCSIIDLEGKWMLPCLGAMEINAPWNSLAEWCEDKIRWYCGILQIPRDSTLVAA